MSKHEIKRDKEDKWTDNLHLGNKWFKNKWKIIISNNAALVLQIVALLWNYMKYILIS